MKISRLVVSKLFDIYDYDMDFSQESVKILTGPNGYGKTTVLTMLSALAKKDFLYFFRFPFGDVSIYFDNGDAIKVSSKLLDTGPDTSSYDPVEIEFCYIRNGSKNTNSMRYVLSLDKIIGALRNRRYIGDIDSNYLMDELSANINEQGSVYDSIAAEQKQDTFMVFISSFKAYFIPAQRLSYIPKDDGGRNLPPRYRALSHKVSSVDEVVNSLKNLLNEKRNEYSDALKKHNNQLMHRLMSSNGEGAYSEEEYNKKKKSLEEQIERLRSFNMIDDVDLFPYDDKRKDELSLYIDDVFDNIETYNDIVGKLRIFSEIVKEKDFADKTIEFSPDDGLVITSSAGRPLDANMLSSGEQNEIIMLYRLIFDVADDSVLLVDEPEISLHVAWQMDFLKDVEKIAETKNLQVIIATHSPQIINEDWEKCFDFYRNRMGHNG